MIVRDYGKESIELHRRLKGKFEIKSKVSINTRDDLSIAYTPGIGAVSQYIYENPEEEFNLTSRANTVAIVSDGSAVLGLGNIKARGALPVMEGKAILFKEFGDVDGIPIVLSTQDKGEIVRTVRNIAPTFGGINLEDIAAPICFEVEEELQDLGIPVFHDDQHGTAIVVLAGLFNAIKVTRRKIEDLKIVVNGAGAAGLAITKLIGKNIPVADIVVCDSRGIIHTGRDGMNKYKDEVAKITNKEDISGSLQEALVGADVFIGVSKAGLLTSEMVKTMNKKPMIFALANPVPEIMPDVALAAGAAVVATGRSDFPNQLNNVLAFPGIFRGALDARAPRITEEMKVACARALADYVKNPTHDMILPSPLDKGVGKVVADAVRKCAGKQEVFEE